MNLLKRASVHPRAAFPLLVSAAILVLHAGVVRAADKMVGGEFATKGIVTSTVGPNGATGQPASVLTFTDAEVEEAARRTLFGGPALPDQLGMGGRRHTRRGR